MARDMRNGEEPKDKRNKGKKIVSDCPGGNQSCGNCGTNVSIISPEELRKGLEENPCKDSSCAACNKECGDFVVIDYTK